LPKRALTAAIVSTMLFGCATATYTPPQGALPDNERIVAKSFDDTWTLLIDHVSKSFFAIDRFEKASGLMTLSFGSSEPWRYIDCGHFKGEALGGAHTVDQSYAAFLADRNRATLQGKMNIVVRQVDGRSTAVRVSARYIFTTPPNPVRSGPDLVVRLRSAIDCSRSQPHRGNTSHSHLPADIHSGASDSRLPKRLTM